VECEMRYARPLGDGDVLSVVRTLGDAMTAMHAQRKRTELELWVARASTDLVGSYVWALSRFTLPSLARRARPQSLLPKSYRAK
jgi:hypothetical protein